MNPKCKLLLEAIFDALDEVVDGSLYDFYIGFIAEMEYQQGEDDWRVEMALSILGDRLE